MDELSEILSSGVAVGVYDETLDTYRRYDINLQPSESSLLIQQNFGVGTTNLEIFDRIVAKLPLSVDYVYFRDSQYLYSLVYGDLSYSGNSFTGSNVTRIDYYTYTGSSNQPTFTVSHSAGFSLNVSNYLVYSNLGDYPMLGGVQGVYRWHIASFSVLGLFSIFVLLYRFARYRLGL